MGSEGSLSQRVEVVGSTRGAALNDTSTWQRGPGPREDRPGAPPNPRKGFVQRLRSVESLLHPKALQEATSRDRWSVTEQSPGSHRILSPVGKERKTIRELLLPRAKEEMIRAEGVRVLFCPQSCRREPKAKMPPSGRSGAALPKKEN